VTFTLDTHLAFMLSGTVRRMTAKSSFTASDLMAGEKPVTVYISVPPADADRVRPLTRLLLQALMYPNMREIEHAQDGRKKRHELLLVIDEMPQLGRLDVLEKGLAVCAGYGIKALLVAQSLDQISTSYGAYQSITGNMQAVLAIPGFSGHGLETLVRWAGERRVAQHGRSRQPGLKALLPTSSENEARAPTLNPRELLIRGKSETLVFVQGALPTWVKAAPYYKHPYFKGRFGQSPSKGLYGFGHGLSSENSPMPRLSAASESSPRQLPHPEGN
jgi:type IV secretion system protein VirD4